MTPTKRSTDSAKRSTTDVPRKILGVDPGLNTTGYGVIENVGGQFRLCEAGTVRSRSSQSIEQRVNELHQGIVEVIQQHQPELMALEQLFSHYDRPRTAILMGHARGVICLYDVRCRLFFGRESEREGHQRV